MAEAFVIMQIGNPELERMYHEAIVPAIKACGLEPKRVDKHNRGGLLNSEIARFIKSANIIVADLTNSRPNCYLEVGYAMGLDKFNHLILSANENHNVDSPNHVKGQKVHFDLSGYEVLFWDPKNLSKFKEELEKKIRNRLADLPLASPAKPILWGDKWFSTKRDKAISGFSTNIGGNVPGLMEIRMTLPDSKLAVPQHDLLQIAEKSTIDTFGWPLGVVLNKEKDRPRPETDGIYAEISIGSREWSYDYWAIKKDGSFYLLQNLFEDEKSKGQIFIETRIKRITEVFLYAAKLYSGLGVNPESPIAIRVEHEGLKGRVIVSVSHGPFWKNHVSDIGEVASEIVISIKAIESNLVELVWKFSGELFTVFDFFRIDKNELERIVVAFREGKRS